MERKKNWGETTSVARTEQRRGIVDVTANQLGSASSCGKGVAIEFHVASRPTLQGVLVGVGDVVLGRVWTGGIWRGAQEEVG